MTVQHFTTADDPRACPQCYAPPVRHQQHPDLVALGCVVLMILLMPAVAVVDIVERIGR